MLLFSFVVRWLLVVCLFWVSSFSCAAEELYLSDAEKALIALVLKSVQEVSIDPYKIDIKTQKQRFTEISSRVKEYKDLEPTVIRVNSFENFMGARRDDALFQEYRLDEIDEKALFEKLKPIRFQSDSLRMQRKIEAYEAQRTDRIRSFFKSLGLEALRLGQIENLNIESLRTEVKNAFEAKASDMTEALSEQKSFQVLLLGKLLKSYFKALPDYQKLEILFRISQMPFESKPVDVLLTMIQSSGPQMQKLIQIMGRSEHVPAEFQEVFQKLESQVREVPWWKVRKILLAQKVALEKFTYFERKPIGVGTMAQTHRAQYIDDLQRRHNIVIRFLKPEIAKYLEMDHEILKQISIEIDNDPEMKSYNLPSLRDLVDDLHSSVVEELDVAKTVQQQGRGQRIYSRQEMISFNGQKNILNIHVPGAGLYASDSEVMVQDLIFGVKPFQEFDQYKEIYPDLYRVVSEKVAEMWVEEAFFKSGFFHADLHQGNLLAFYGDNKVTLNILDFGMTGQLTQQLRESALLLALGIKLDRADLIAEHFLKLGTMSNPEINGPKLSSLVQSRIDRMTIEPGLGGSLEAWTAWALDLGLELHYEFLKLNRGLTAIEGLLSDSKSTLSIQQLAQRVALRNKSYVTRLLLQEPQMRWADYGKIAFSIFDESEPQKRSSGAGLRCEAFFQ